MSRFASMSPSGSSLVKRSITSPSIRLLMSMEPYNFGSTPLSALFSRSMAIIALSIVSPLFASCATAAILSQRADLGTKKMFFSM